MVEVHVADLTRKVDEIGELYSKRLAQMETYKVNFFLHESERKPVDVDSANFMVWLFTPHPIMNWKDLPKGDIDPDFDYLT